MARPKLDPADRRGEFTAIRLTPSERALLDRAARRKGTTLSTFIREAALRSAVRVGR